MIALQHLWLILQLGTRAQPAAAASDSPSLTGIPVACKGERVSRIDIHARPPFEVKGHSLPKRALRLVARQHMTTRDGVILRYLALQVGDRCTELRRAESERILRVQPFIADADVIAIPDGNGGVVLDVSTVDEASLILGGGVSTKSPHIRSMRVGDANLLGDALYTAVVWRHGARFRDEVWGKITDYQFLGRPYQLAVWGGRRELGGTWAMEASHPFLTDLQRLSWRTTAGSDDSYFYFLRQGAVPAAIKFNRNYKDIGGVVRVGRPGSKLALLGGSISHEVEESGQSPVRVTDAGVVSDTTTALMNRFRNRRSTRLNTLWGVRNVRYVRARGMDALEGTQDLRTGLEVAALLGKGIKGLNGQDDDLFASSEVYGGMGSPLAFAGLDLSVEGRHGRSDAWDGVLAHGRVAAYLKTIPLHTLMSELTWSAGWKQRVPFQVTFLDPEGGLRGFANSDFGGARRMIARFEDRYVLRRVSQLGTLGLGAFLDAGKIWAGDAPLGTTSPLSMGAGISILAAVPSQSRRMWRIDLGYPLRGNTKRGLEIRFSNRDLTRMFRREPGDIYSSRERSVPSSVFNWP